MCQYLPTLARTKSYMEPMAEIKGPVEENFNGFPILVFPETNSWFDGIFMNRLNIHEALLI